MKKPNKIIVTRHQGLVQWLVAHGYAAADTPVIAHACAEDVRDKDVIGILPMVLACQARTVTEIPIMVPPEMRGVELTMEQVDQYRTGEPVTYCVVPEREFAGLRDWAESGGLTTGADLPEWREYALASA